MRSTHSRRFVLLGAALLGTVSAAAADDALFLPSYQRMGLLPGSGTSTAATTPAPAPTTPIVPPRAIGRPRLTTWPNQAPAPAHHHHQGQAAPASPESPTGLWRRLGLRDQATIEPAPVLAAPPAAGPTVASVLSVPSVAAPASVAPAPPRLLARFRRAEPLVPPGRPHGIGPAEMIPPEPLGPDPMMADSAGSAARRSADLDRVEANSGLAAQPTLASRPEDSATSPFAPVSARDRLGMGEQVAQMPARRPSRSIPPLIARPTEPEADAPLRQVGAGEADLQPQPPPSLSGPSD